MPLKRCTNSEGKQGWSWGDGGCQVGKTDLESKKIAIKVGLKVAGPSKFKKIMEKDKAAFIDQEGLKLAQAIYKEHNKLGMGVFINKVAKYFSKSDCEDMASVDDKVADDDTDVRDGEHTADVPGKADLVPRTSGAPDNDDIISDEASLDTPVENIGQNIVVPPYNKEASPETDPSKEVPSYDPPTRDDITAKSAEMFAWVLAKEGTPSYNEEEDKGCMTDGDDDMTMGEADFNMDNEECKSISRYFSDKKRKNMKDLGDPKKKAFPVEDQEDLENAARMLHFSKNPEKVKKNLVRIAHKRGLKLPPSLS